MELGSKTRRRGITPKAGSVWESRMKIDEVKGGIKVFNENSPQNSQKSELEIPKTNQSPIGKRKTWKSESLDGSPVKIAFLGSELSGEIKRSPISTKKLSLRKIRDDGDDENEGVKNCVDEKEVVENEREKKSRSDEDCKDIKATISSNETQICGEDEQDLDQNKEKIEVENKRIVIEEKSNKTLVPISPIVRKQPQTTAKINTNSDNVNRIQRTSSKLQSFVDLVMWRDASKSAFVFGTGTFAIISSSYTTDLNISFISVLSYLGLVYLAAIFLFRSLISRGSIDKDDSNQDCVVGEEEAIWVMKILLPYVNEFLLKVRALFSGDPATTMKVLLEYLLCLKSAQRTPHTLLHTVHFGWDDFETLGRHVLTRKRVHVICCIQVLSAVVHQRGRSNQRSGFFL